MTELEATLFFEEYGKVCKSPEYRRLFSEHARVLAEYDRKKQEIPLDEFITLTINTFRFLYSAFPKCFADFLMAKAIFYQYYYPSRGIKNSVITKKEMEDLIWDAARKVQKECSPDSHEVSAVRVFLYENRYLLLHVNDR